MKDALNDKTVLIIFVALLIGFYIGFVSGKKVKVDTTDPTNSANQSAATAPASNNQPQYSIENFGRPKASDAISYVMPVAWKPGETVTVESIDVHEDTVSTRPHQEAGQPRLTIKAFDGLKKSELEKGAEKITQDKRSLYTFDKWSNSDSIFWLIEDDKAEVTYLFEFHKGSENVASNIIESIKFGRDRT